MYGLDKPMYTQYLLWVGRLLKGDMGRSFAYRRPVADLILERLPATVALSVTTLVFTFLIAIPIGILSAVKQYSLADYVATTVGFIGMSIPEFLFALALMLFFYKTFGLSVTGLFSREYAQAPWSWGKFVDMLLHLPVPILVVGLAGTAGTIRTMRGMLLDELRKPYVQTARAKGVSERTLLWKYPVRVALLPIVATIGWSLRGIFSGSTIVAIVLDLPTIGPLLFQALLNEDMYLASSSVLITTILTVVGTFISDVLLVWLDPRIRYG
jgi:peptide/nickel transport system permease protein